MNWIAKMIFRSLVEDDYKRIRMTVAPDTITAEQCQEIVRDVMEWVLEVHRSGFQNEADRQNPGVTGRIWSTWMRMRRKKR